LLFDTCPQQFNTNKVITKNKLIFVFIYSNIILICKDIKVLISQATLF